MFFEMLLLWWWVIIFEESQINQYFSHFSFNEWRLLLIWAYFIRKTCQFLSFGLVKNIVENCSPRSPTSFHQCSTSREISHILVKSCSLLHLCYNLHKGAFGDNLVRWPLVIYRWFKRTLIQYDLNWEGVIRNIYNIFIIRQDFLQSTFVQCM